ncbi:HNH endonuclease signature motif containing protein [Halobacterium salinarum]|uniref:HNH endonuclease signature motif containing protein n=1 Tax=Halobacterium salinarum TaxID=2242 RepID=UPI002556A23D|nr:HNH endonuclease signature motif containing protein [Halobacterium salinarum]MDL0126520.1 HNH endonuclease signature motif containing protein [Halobacterium salinarum]MDL0131180.1 HNH endonuclease signature motif containing protein [Halobacterium salinarum]MDL0132488.1 HNH endonuclease signature motif containing protein [Halobacterium salinarum]MDL0143556.1 HNH endonuclease signature motif containing protein [Halobacterium salinarum]
MSEGDFREAVYAAWGQECLVCGRSPEGWLNTTRGERRQDKLSLHHINGDDTDDRVENVIPLCQSCHVHIHKVDEPPYRQWHRQLPSEHRNAWNGHYDESYEGPRLNSKQAEWFFGDDQGTPESEKYRRHEPTTPSQNASNSPDETTVEPPREATTVEASVVATEDSDNKDTTKERHGVDPDLDPETVSIEYGSPDGDRCRIRFVERDDGPGWWQRTEEWTGHRWRPTNRDPITDLNITTY